jgi:hypothetical protein
MLKNTNYNLLEEITQLSKALYRFESYVRDAEADETACDGCVELWKSMGRRHEEDLERLLQHFRTHFDRGLVEFKSATRRPTFGVDPFS